MYRVRRVANLNGSLFFPQDGRYLWRRGRFFRRRWLCHIGWCRWSRNWYWWAGMQNLCQIWLVLKCLVVLGVAIGDSHFWSTSDVTGCGNARSSRRYNTNVVRFFAVPLKFLPKSFLNRYFLYLKILCSNVFSWMFFGRLLIYWPSSVIFSFFVPILAISEFRTRTSGRAGSLMTLVVGLIFLTVLPRARTLYKPSSFFFCYELHVFSAQSWPVRSCRFAELFWR